MTNNNTMDEWEDKGELFQTLMKGQFWSVNYGILHSWELSLFQLVYYSLFSPCVIQINKTRLLAMDYYQAQTQLDPVC